MQTGNLGSLADAQPSSKMNQRGKLTAPFIPFLLADAAGHPSSGPFRRMGLPRQKEP